MSAMDLVAVLLGVVCLTATAVLAATISSLRRQLARLAELVAVLDDRAVPAAARLEAAAGDAATQVGRVSDLLDAAAAMSATAEAAGRVLSTPVIKSAAIAAGTQRAARRLRSRPNDDRRRQEGA